MIKKLSHEDLVKLAASWLRRTNHPVVITEVASQANETPDALGWHGTTSTLVECKLSRADFRADAKKICRVHPSWGLGDFRYFLAPRGLIKPEEVPPNWGLLETNGRSVRRVKRATRIKREPMSYIAEHHILLSLIRRIGQNAPKGVSIRCYVHENKNRATLSVARDLD